MITAKFYCKPDRGTIHMEIRGHSGSAPKGEDLICSAATMLAYTAAQAIQFMSEQGKLKRIDGTQGIRETEKFAVEALGL